MKDPWLAVNLSLFFPGLGQLYAANFIRGLVLITVQILFIGTGLWSVFSPEGDVASGLIYLAIAIGVYIFNLFDALLLIYYQAPEVYQERIPRKVKNPWFAVAISRILPGLGHFYANKSVLGLILLTSSLVCLRLQVFYWPLLILTPFITAIAAYHSYISFSPKGKRTLISLMTGAIFCVGLLMNYIPKGIDQRLAMFILPSQSMHPTLETGDRIFVGRDQNYQPQRQDVIVFHPTEKLKELDPSPAEYYTKRIIGLPGEIVTIQAGIVYINGTPLVEDYLGEIVTIQAGIVYINGTPLVEDYLAENPDYEFKSPVIPDNQYFVLGDNRNDSFDSHIWGMLPRENIYGKAYKIYWPLQRVRSLLNTD